MAEKTAQRLLWGRYDSLTKAVQEAIPFQRVGKRIDPQFQLPQKASSAFQPVGSNACGFYVLSFMEMEIRPFRTRVALRTS